MELFIKTLPYLTGAVGSVFFIWGAWRLSVVTTLQKAVDAQKELVSALTAKVETLETQRGEDRETIAELKGQLAGKRDAYEDLLVALRHTDLCLNAPSCPRRSIPTGGE